MGIETPDKARLPVGPTSPWILKRRVVEALTLLEGFVDQWQADEAPIKNIAIQEIKAAIFQARRDLGLDEGR